MSKPPVTVSQCLLHRDPVGREAKAFLRRYALLAALGGRSDLKGAPKDEQLARELEYQLVYGVDLLSADPNAGFPIPAGVRLERLAYSPWLCEEQLPAGVFRLPTNVDEFVRQFQAVTGIGPDEGELFEAVYRITPAALGEIAMEVRDREEEPWPNFRLLLSREFKLLEQNSATAILWQPPQNAPHFNRPAIDGFLLLAEIEREACISRDLTWLNREMNRSELRHLLEHADKVELGRVVSKAPNLKRLLSYGLVQSDALASAMEETGSEDALKEGSSSWFAAAAGKSTSNLGDPIEILGERGSWARQALLSAFASPPDSRRSVENGDAATFWNFDNQLISRLARVQLAEEYKGGIRKRGHISGDARSALAQVIARHCDPVTAETLDQRSTRQAGSRTDGRVPTLANLQKGAGGYSKYQLPSAGKPGAAPRFSPSLWQKRYADFRLWHAILRGDSKSLKALELSEREAKAFDDALAAARSDFSAALVGVTKEDGRLAVMAACDLATAVSAISTNRALVRALKELLDTLLQTKATQEADEDKSASRRDVSHRIIPGSAAFLKARRKTGSQPSPSSPRANQKPKKSERHESRRRVERKKVKDSHTKADDRNTSSPEPSDPPHPPIDG